MYMYIFIRVGFWGKAAAFDFAHQSETPPETIARRRFSACKYAAEIE